MAMSSPNLMWSTVDCMLLKNFICEQTRSYHYNYGSISVPASLRFRSPYIKHSLFDSTSATAARISIPTAINEAFEYIYNDDDSIKNSANSNLTKPITASGFTNRLFSAKYNKIFKTPLSKIASKSNIKINSGPVKLPNITSFFARSLDNVPLNLGTHKIDSIVQTTLLSKEYVDTNQTKFAETPTIGPYDSLIQDYQADEGETTFPKFSTGDNISDDDASTVIPEAGSLYKYNIKVRNNGKILDHSP
ncbi:uncharacterized protein LOC116417902 isoform X2 [Nasonia vitripennis]|nr:uncharacterized protein LOC116417902 isoform X2 [Nasonia vitripennis]